MKTAQRQRQVPDARVFEPAFEGFLSDENRHYLGKVLRLRDGDSFVVTDGRGHEGLSRWGADGALRVEQVTEPHRDPKLQITLYAALTKGDRFEWLLEKAVELGVACVVPLICRHGVVRDLSTPKLERYRKIALAAMLQSGGCCLPLVEKPISCDRLPKPGENTKAWVLHEEVGGAACLPMLQPTDEQLWISSGPEGGFAGEEIDLLTGRGWQPVSLGRRRLRAETAPLVAAAAVLLKTI